MALRNAHGLPERRSAKTALTELRRAIRESLGRFDFGPGEAASVLAHLGSDCGYCGDRATLWDLLVPLRHEGEVVLGNVVPACRQCRALKGEQRFDEWMVQERSSPARRAITNTSARLRRLRTYMDRFGYTPQSLDERLGAEGWAALNEVRRHESALRRAVSQLFDIAERVRVPPNKRMKLTKREVL